MSGGVKLKAAKGAKAKCDRLFSLIVRAEGKCQRCGIPCSCPEFPRSHTTGCRLTCSHDVVGRRYSWARTCEDNCSCLCYSCHYHLENHPVEHAEWIVGLRGDATVRAVRERANRTDKFDWAAEYERLVERARELGIR